MVTGSLSEIIDIERRVSDLSRSDPLPEYTNVELIIDDDSSVLAKYSGSVADGQSIKKWLITSNQNGEEITLNNNSFTINAEHGTGHNGVKIVSLPSFAQYAQMVGRTVHAKFTLSLSGVDCYAFFGFCTHANKEAAESDIRSDRAVSLPYSYNETVETDIVIGENYESSYSNDYVSVWFGFHSNGSGSLTVSNISFEIDADEEDSVLSARCPWGTSAMAQQILNNLAGFHYRPYEATRARLDMAAEIGDGVQIDGTEFGLYAQDIRFGSECTSDLRAPFDREINHEFKYVPAAERRFQRSVATLKAEIDIRSGEIEAKVEERVPSEYGSQSVFGWLLQKDNFSVYSGGQTVLKVDKDGASITGNVVATGGEIGGCEIRNGKLIVASANIGNISATQITADYISVDRIEPKSLKSGKLADNSVIPRVIQGGAVSFGKTDNDVQGYLSQAGRAWADVQGVKKSFDNILIVNTLQINGNLFVKQGTKTLTFRPFAFSQGGMRWVLGSADR